MIKSFKLRRVIAATAIGFIGLGTGTAVLAATASATNSSNPNFTVTLAVSPNQLRAGQTATVTTTVTNNTAAQQSVTLNASVLAPNGRTFSEPAQSVTLSPGQTLTQTQTELIDASYPRGTYRATFSASGASPSGSPAQSTATVTYTIVK